jgi:hypothetical protein
MTWKSIFDLSTMEHQHIVYTYAVVLIVNAAYFGRLVYSWVRPRS